MLTKQVKMKYLGKSSDEAQASKNRIQWRGWCPHPSINALKDIPDIISQVDIRNIVSRDHCLQIKQEVASQEWSSQKHHTYGYFVSKGSPVLDFWKIKEKSYYSSFLNNIRNLFFKYQPLPMEAYHLNILLEIHYSQYLTKETKE